MLDIQLAWRRPLFIYLLLFFKLNFYMLPYSIHTLAYYSFAIVMLCVEKSWKPSVQIISVSNEGE